MGKTQKPYSLPKTYVTQMLDKLEPYKSELKGFGMVDENDRIILSRVIRALADRGLPQFLRDLEVLHKSHTTKASGYRPT